MNYGFNHDQFHKDVEDFLKFFTSFGKSFFPSAKKVQGKEIGMLEQTTIRFRLYLVDLGITQVIRLGIVAIVGIVLWLVVFRNAMLDVRVITLFGFIAFVGWMMSDHLIKDGEPIHVTAKVTMGVFDFWKELYSGIKDFLAEVFDEIKNITVR
jgi:hypothetical protein